MSILTIASEIVSSLNAQLTTGNGYHYDMSGRVFSGKQNFNDNSELPFISVLIHGGDIEQTALNRTRLNEMAEVIFEAKMFPDDINNPADSLYKMYEDLKKVITFLSETNINNAVSSFVFDDSEWGLEIPEFDDEPCSIIFALKIEF